MQNGGEVQLFSSPTRATRWIDHHQRTEVQEEIIRHSHPVSGDVFTPIDVLSEQDLLSHLQTSSIPASDFKTP